MRKHLKDYFVPHEGNDYKPHSLQKAAVVGMLGMVLLSFTLANIQSLVWVGSEWMVSTILPAVIVDLTNEEREDAALGALKRNSLLDEAARLKAKDMAKNEYFAHYSPTGVTPWHWFGQVSYNFVHAGENLAVHFTDSGDVVGAWMDSPTHRANIMNGNYTEIGVGSAEGTYEGYPTVFVVQLFGTPAASTSVALESAEEESIQAAPESGFGSTTTAVLANETAATNSVTVLAESVVLSESVEIIESEPVPVEVLEVTASDEEDQGISTATEIVDMTVTDKGISLYSDFISTSTGGVPASIEPKQTHVGSTVPYSLRLFTQPHAVLQIMYMLIGLFVFVALIISIVIEIKRQEPLQIVYGLALLLLMYGLFEMHAVVSGGALIL